ncbi:MAG TPA: hypothetical protein VN577_07170 [Terriglobales bacterium]|nr:hypothetical protein [Terriglobales bacterium]
MRRILPAVGLFFLAPLVAEFLLGNMSITMLGTLIVLAPMYGGGALLIREVVRRNDRGWPTIITLGLAFGILEEAFMTQSLFNPDYLGMNLHLLDPAYIPALGIGGWWTVFVLMLHSVWSISVPIALTESCVPERSTKPWLGRIGLLVVAVLFVLATISITSFSIKQDRVHFVASMTQFVSAAVICLVVIVFAFRLPKPAEGRAPGAVPNAWLVGLISLAAGSVFLVVPNRWAWSAVMIYITVCAGMIGAAVAWSQRSSWGGLHRLALAGGAALAYAWHAFVQNPSVGRAGTINRIGNVVFAAGAVILLFVAARRNRARQESAKVMSA